MSDKKCEHCYYGEQCLIDDVCEYYDPLFADDSDKYDTQRIEDNRIAFRSLWFEYIENFNN